jgi:hypothetical protein
MNIFHAKYVCRLIYWAEVQNQLLIYKAWEICGKPQLYGVIAVLPRGHESRLSALTRFSAGTLLPWESFAFAVGDAKRPFRRGTPPSAALEGPLDGWALGASKSCGALRTVISSPPPAWASKDGRVTRREAGASEQYLT